MIKSSFYYFHSHFQIDIGFFFSVAPQSLFSSNSGHTTTILHTHHETHSLHLSLPSFPGPAFDGVGQSQPHKEMNNASNNSTSSSLFTRATRGGKLQRSGGGPAANGVGISGLYFSASPPIHVHTFAYFIFSFFGGKHRQCKVQRTLPSTFPFSLGDK